MDSQGRSVNPSQAYTWLFAGAGAGALSLLYALHSKNLLAGKRILICEPQEKDQNDRTWCFWTNGEDPAHRLFHPQISHRWERIDGPWSEARPLAPNAYVQIRSRDFYRACRSVLASYPEVEWRTAKVIACTEQNEGVQVRLSDGKTVQAERVFDSRLPQDLPTDGLLWQSFVGWRFRAKEGAVPPDLCALMDFAVPQSGSVQFMYWLPTGEREGLVEFTRFGTEVLTEAESTPHLEAYLKGRGLDDWEIVEKEIDRIPMSLALNQSGKTHAPSQRIIPLGTAAGAVKASTGFAFKRIADHAWRLAGALEKEDELPKMGHPRQFWLYDDLLLRVLKEKPHWGKPIFDTLFKRQPLSRIFRFLDENTPWHEDLRIMYTMPWRPFLWSLARRVGLSFGVALLAVILVFLRFSLGETPTENLSPWLLLAGLIFPGIPHGAADHWVQLGPKARELRQLILFTLRYLGLMALVLALWFISPALGLSSFLLYSAWHFGQTDMESWQNARPVANLLWGGGVLGFILFSHAHAFAEFLDAYALGPWVAFVRQNASWGVGLSAALLLSPLLWIGRHHRPAWLGTAATVVLGAFLPLLLAFGLYFVGLHSFRGWRDLKEGLQVNDRQLLRYAAPFSLGAFALLGVGMALAWQGARWQEWWPWLFVFIAAISAPHIGVMHRLYRKRRA